jgi:hypothetical protein
MSALGDAKVVLAEVPAITHSADRLKMALAALVAQIEAAPTGQSLGVVIYHDDERFAADNEGKRVRLVGVE